MKWNIERFKQQLEEIVNIDSDSYDLEGVGKVGTLVKSYIESIGMENIQCFDDNTRIMATTKNQDEIDILFAGHMDTVFPKGTVQMRPYTQKDGFGYGPGICDMKAGIIMGIHLAEALMRARPDLNICLAFNGDEEIGSPKAEEWFKELARNSKYAFVLEPGRNEKCLVRSRKGCADLFLKIYGKAAHAGNEPEKGINAVIELNNWISKLYELHRPDIGTTVNPGIIKGGTASNVIPDYAEATFDIRVLEMKELDAIRDRVSYLLEHPVVKGVKVEANLTGIYPPMVPSESTLELIERLNQIAKESGIPIDWVDAGGVSDANHIAGEGTPVLCGCGPVGGNMHSDDEFLDLNSIEQRLELFYKLIVEL